MGDWENDVDETLMSLTSAQRSTDKELDDLDLKYQAIDKVIRGDPEQDTDGIIARLHNLENGLQELRAERLKSKLSDETNKGIKWQSWTAIIVAILGILGAILQNRIREAFQAKEVHYQPDTKLLREIQKDKERHRRRKTHSESGLSSIPLLAAPTSQLQK